MELRAGIAMLLIALRYQKVEDKQYCAKQSTEIVKPTINNMIPKNFCERKASVITYVFQ